MQLLADSLGKAEVLSEAESYFWQGLAYYRMMQVHTAEARLHNDTNEAPEKKEKVVLKVTADAEKVVFTIEDTGIVIPPEEAEHINVSPSNG